MSDFQNIRKQETIRSSILSILQNSDLTLTIAFSLAGLVATLLLSTHLSSLDATSLVLAQLQ